VPAACLDNDGQPGAKSLWREAAMGGKTRQRRWKWLAGVLVVASGASGCAAPGGAPTVPSGLELAIADGGLRLPVLFMHGHSRDPADVWFEDGGGQAFSKFIAFNPTLAIDAFYLKMPLHGNSFPQNQNRSIVEDAEDILAAIEGALDSHGAILVGILNMPAYQAGGRVAIVACSQGTLSSRYYAKNLMGSPSGGVTVSEFVTIAAATSCDVNFQSALMASGQITMRKVDGWQTLAQVPTAQPVDHAA
jgi:hypothetical protein